jgi:S-formylglutathione hydrolase FrmB
MFIPNDPRADAPANPNAGKPMKTLILLHGYTGDGDIWVNPFQCAQHNVAVAAPSGENGFWLDGISTGHKYATLLGVELIEYLRNTFGLAKTKEDTAVMGLSMGGFGALHTALMFPEIYGKCAALSSALIHNEVCEMKEGEGNDVANYEYYRECFGEPSKLKESVNNPEFLVKQLKEKGAKFPEIYMACGTEDFLIEPNRKFHAFLESEGVEHTYMESKGIHDMVFWSEYAEKFIPKMFPIEK